MPDIRTMRDYQADLYRRVNRSRNNGKDAVMLLPTGAGKTAIARNHCSHILNHPNHFGINRIIITTPQKQILEGFKRTNNEEWFIKGTHSSQKIDNIEIIEIPNESIGNFLKGSSGGSIAISCIQSITNQRSNAFNPFLEIEDCSSILWVIDEAHHIEAEQTAIVIEEFKKKNGKILYLTATPFNANGALRILNNPDIEIIHRSLGEHMNDGFAPELDMSYEMFDINAGAQTNYNYFKSDLSKMSNWAECISKSYHKDNCPKTLIIIPSFSKSGDGNVEDLDTENAANVLKSELEKLNPGIKIFVAVGNDSSGEISRNIEVEANTFPGHDIIIACRRFDEGTDVPSICAVYHVGMTGCRRIIQLMGRALRNKSAIKGFGEKYPEYLDKSIFKFFIFNTTKLSEEDVENNQFNFSLQAIKTINAVQNFRSYDIISGAVRVRKNLQNKIEKLLEEDPENPDIEILEELVSEIEQPIISLETAGENDDSMIALLAHNKMDHTNEEALENSSEISKAYVESSLLSDELKTDDDVENFVNKSIERKRVKRNTNIISEELQELVIKYANEKVKYVESDLIKKFVTSIDRNTLEEWGDVLWDTYDNEEKQLEQVKAIVKFYEENGRTPSQKSKDTNEKKLGNKLGTLKQAYNGSGKCTMRFYQTTLNYLTQINMLDILKYNDLAEIQLDQTKEIIKFFEENGRIPQRKLESSTELRLHNIFRSLKQAYNTPNTTTARIYPETINYLNSIDMTYILKYNDFVGTQLDQIKEILNFYKETGKIPSTTSKDPNEKKMGNKLSNLKYSYNFPDKCESKIFPETIDYLKSNNAINILQNIDLEGIQLDQIKEIIKFYKETDKIPSTRSNDPNEKKLGHKLRNLKNSYNNPDEATQNIYSKTINYLKSIGELDILNNINHKEDQLKQIKEIVTFYNVKNNKIPSQKSTDSFEKRLGQKLSQLKKAYHSPEKTHAKIYQETIDYLNSINMLHILNKQR